jgi:hypothetical protein
MEEIMLAEGLHDCGRSAVPIFSYALEFALQLRKNKVTLSQSSQLVSYTRRCVNLDAFLGAASTGLQSIKSSSAALGWHKCLPS